MRNESAIHVIVGSLKSRNCISYFYKFLMTQSVERLSIADKTTASMLMLICASDHRKTAPRRNHLMEKRETHPNQKYLFSHNLKICFLAFTPYLTSDQSINRFMGRWTWTGFARKFKTLESGIKTRLTDRQLPNYFLQYVKACLDSGLSTIGIYSHHIHLLFLNSSGVLKSKIFPSSQIES